MSDDGAELMRLYEASNRAYYAYQRVANGEDLVGSQRVSPARAEAARADWIAALRELHEAQGYSKERIRELLQEQAAEVA